MDKGFAVLEIDPEFKTLIRPLRKDEYLQLEVNLAVDGWIGSREYRSY